MAIKCNVCGTDNPDTAIRCSVCNELLGDDTGGAIKAEFIEIGARARFTVTSAEMPLTINDKILAEKLGIQERSSGTALGLDCKRHMIIITDRSARCFVNNGLVHGETVLPETCYVKICSISDDKPAYAFKVRTSLLRTVKEVCPNCGMAAVVSGRCTNCKWRV